MREQSDRALPANRSAVQAEDSQLQGTREALKTIESTNSVVRVQAVSRPIIQFNSIYLCAKLNSPEANYKVSTGKEMGRVRKKVKTMY
jgi:hypothetical protein